MTTVIHCGRLIDGAQMEPVHDATVILEDSRVVYAGPRAGASWPPSAQILDLPGSTVMPGLIDVHVHITADGGLASMSAVLGGGPESFTDSALKGYANALKSLKMGYTTLRDLHAPGYADVAVRNSIRSGRLVGPRLLVCGQGLCITGGHMDKLRYPHHVTAAGRVGVCDTPDGFRQAVRQHVKMGVDLIKINSDGGSLRDPKAPYRQEMSFAEMKAACDEAHKFGLHVAAHTAGGPPIEEAILAGVNTIEHGHWLTDRAIDLMLEHNAYYVPTLIVNTRNFDYDPQTLGVSDASWRWLQLAYDAKWGSLERAHKAGVKIAAGSDAGFLVNHDENAAELEEMVKGGLTPMEAIQAATSTAAALLDLQDEIGVLAAGKKADVVIVDGDPLADITILQREEKITYVFKDGRMVKSPQKRFEYPLLST
jgi:imidazolonepropionase-like amidohydrolase